MPEASPGTSAQSLCADHGHGHGHIQGLGHGHGHSDSSGGSHGYGHGTNDARLRLRPACGEIGPKKQNKKENSPLPVLLAAAQRALGPCGSAPPVPSHAAQLATSEPTAGKLNEGVPVAPGSSGSGEGGLPQAP